jgi:hypothetical protein
MDEGGAFIVGFFAGMVFLLVVVSGIKCNDDKNANGYCGAINQKSIAIVGGSNRHVVCDDGKQFTIHEWKQ